MRLKELVRKYKLDEEVWLSKSANLETSVSELTVSEHNVLSFRAISCNSSLSVSKSDT
jgi:hypothetical protein